MTGSNFNLYNEPIEFQWLVFAFNIFVYGGLIFSALHIIRLALFDKAKLVLSNWTILGISAIAVALNIYARVYIEIWGFIALYLLAGWLSWKWIDRKSLRWTNISLALFFLFTLGMYNLFNTKLQTITYSFFSFNDIVEYSFTFKNYFEIYLPGQELAQTKILIDKEWLTRGTEPVHFRLYLFYYFMQSCAIAFWLFIFFDVLKKHMFFYDKQVSKLYGYMFYYAPENFKFSDFKKLCDREIFLAQKKAEKKKLKSGELIKTIVPKPTKNRNVDNKITDDNVKTVVANQNKSKVNVKNNVELIDVTGEGTISSALNEDEIKSNNQAHQQNLIDKTHEKSNLISETTDKTSVSNIEMKEEDMEIEEMKKILLQQAKEMQEKANQLIEMARSIDGTENKSNEVTAALDKIAKLHNDLISNPVFSSITNVRQLRKFMEWHVFAVWDFMSLTKRLQIDLTCVTLPWIPPENNGAARLINSIVWGEESDKTPSGKSSSHFELYLQAMEEIQADTTQIRRFISLLKNGTNYLEALQTVNAPKAAIEFTKSTIETALHGTTAQVLGSFFYGRENVIPEMFEALLKDWNINKDNAPIFVFYLERHIELDSGDHGPAAQRMIENLCPTNKQKMEVYTAAQKAVLARIQLWDSLNIEIKKLA